jgi:hypothetical protein
MVTSLALSKFNITLWNNSNKSTMCTGDNRTCLWRHFAFDTFGCLSCACLPVLNLTLKEKWNQTTPPVEGDDKANSPHVSMCYESLVLWSISAY